MTSEVRVFPSTEGWQPTLAEVVLYELADKKQPHERLFFVLV